MAIEKQELLKRLSFINATEEAGRPEPLCNAAILSFHDSIELFLQLAYEPDFRGKSVAFFRTHQGDTRKTINDFTALVRNATLVRCESFGSVVTDNGIEGEF